MRFSVITVCLNAGNDLKKTIDSVLNQTYEDYEIIVKDGGSKDNSIECITKDNRIKIIQKNDTGIYDAMNQGIQEAKGEYILFINAGDCLYDENVLTKLSDNIKGDALYYGKSYNVLQKSFDVSPRYIDDYFCYRSMICHQAMVFSGKILKKRKYDTAFKICADREWLIYEVCKEKITPHFLPIVIANYQGGGVSDSPKGKILVKKEDKILKRKYFTKKERLIFGIKYLCTFPHIRKIIIKNQYLNRIYKSVVSRIYRT